MSENAEVVMQESPVSLRALADEQATLDALYLARFRDESSIEQDVPAIWGFDAAQGSRATSNAPSQQTWIVTFYCECPGRIHPQPRGREILRPDRPRMSLPSYARWVLNRFKLRLLIARKLESVRLTDQQLEVMSGHLKVLRHLAKLSNDRADPDEYYSPANELFDTFRYNMHPIVSDEPKFGGLTRQLQPDGSYRWLCDQHLTNGSFERKSENFAESNQTSTTQQAGQRKQVKKKSSTKKSSTKKSSTKKSSTKKSSTKKSSTKKSSRKKTAAKKTAAKKTAAKKTSIKKKRKKKRTAKEKVPFLKKTKKKKK